jgi:hypothetical protein
VTALPDGSFLVADTFNHRVLEVSPAGAITTVAGTGTEGFSGDGGPATLAELGEPAAVAVAADGGFLIAEAVNNRVRRVSPTGKITSVAGNGTAGFDGDGGLATEAALDTPQGVAATADGGFLIADTANNRVRFVDADLRFPQGPPGVQGPAGPQGPPGPAGPAARAPLAMALANGRLSGLVRRRVVLRYAATERATVLVRILRGTRTIRRVGGRARAGANTIRFRLPRQAGRYRLRLEARTADGRAASARGVLIVRSPRRGRG